MTVLALLIAGLITSSSSTQLGEQVAIHEA